MNIKPYYQGKVRDLYEVDSERMIIVSSDRISAFDVVFNETIPHKGVYLNRISAKWFRYFESKNSLLYPGRSLKDALGFKTHFISEDLYQFPEEFQKPEFKNRSMLVLKTNRINFEFIIRGYLIGSSWKEYQKNRSISGITLPENLKYGYRFPEPIFTPTTKEEKGKHDEFVFIEDLYKSLGKELTNKISEISISIFKEASLLMEKAGFILCDTKFEFGIKDNQIFLIDEVLTPDSSRFWKIEDYKHNKNIQSYDKQILRDFLEKIHWNKTPPPPPLPQNIIEELQKRYEFIYQKISNILDY